MWVDHCIIATSFRVRIINTKKKLWCLQSMSVALVWRDENEGVAVMTVTMWTSARHCIVYTSLDSQRWWIEVRKRLEVAQVLVSHQLLYSSPSRWPLLALFSPSPSPSPVRVLHLRLPPPLDLALKFSLTGLSRTTTLLFSLHHLCNLPSFKRQAAPFRVRL